MKTFYEALRLLVAFAPLIIACGTQVLPIQPRERSAQESAPYEVMLGESMMDKVVADFIVNNHCYPADQFQLCKEAGMALWADSDQIVRIIYLYAGYADGFKRYQGTLPFGLSFYDPMWRVQEKLSSLDEDEGIHQTGLPDEGRTPDHIHYWANYKRFGITIIYSAPFADEDAYIYAILVSQ
jgi:hypothetical protein